MYSMSGRGPSTTPLPTFAQGSGGPLVLLPGLSLWGSAPQGLARLLESALVLPLSRRHRVHWVGRRPGAPPTVTMADLAADVAEHLRDHFDGPVPVLGFSSGGFLALQLALDHPSLVQSLILVGAGSRLSEVARAQEVRLRDLLEQGQVSAVWGELAADTLGARPARVLGPTIGHLAPAVSPRAAGDAAATCRADLAFDATERLGDVRAPALLVVGLRDSACDPSLAHRTRTGIPGSELLLLPRTGHLASLVHPVATRRIEAFIARHALVGPAPG